MAKLFSVVRYVLSVLLGNVAIVYFSKTKNLISNSSPPFDKKESPTKDKDAQLERHLVNERNTHLTSQTYILPTFKHTRTRTYPPPHTHTYTHLHIE